MSIASLKQRKAVKPSAKVRPGKIHARFGLTAAPGAKAAAKQVLAHFKDLGFTQDLISRMTGFAPRSVASWSSGNPPKPAAARKLTELQRLMDALGEIVVPEYIAEWLQQPNEGFEGSTPAQLIERGEVDRIWQMIHLLGSGQPG